MRFHFQAPIVIQVSTPGGQRWIRSLLALWRATLLSMTIFFLLEGADYLAFQESPLAWFYRMGERLALGLEWLPYQVGKIVPALQAPEALVAHFPSYHPALPSMIVPTLPWPPTPPVPHLLIGNFYLEWPVFGQHMLGSTLTYFTVFMALSELMLLWRGYAHRTVSQ